MTTLDDLEAEYKRLLAAGLDEQADRLGRMLDYLGRLDGTPPTSSRPQCASPLVGSSCSRRSANNPTDMAVDRDDRPRADRLVVGR